jgi:hypothetical protein
VIASGRGSREDAQALVAKAVAAFNESRSLAKRGWRRLRALVLADVLWKAFDHAKPEDQPIEAVYS